MVDTLDEWNNDLGDDSDDRELVDHDFEREEEAPDLLVMMGVSEAPMKDKLRELFECLNHNKLC